MNKNGNFFKSHQNYHIIKPIANSSLYLAKINKENIVKPIEIFYKNEFKNHLIRKNLSPINEKDEKKINNLFLNYIKLMEIIKGKNNENNNSLKFIEYFDKKDKFVIVMEYVDNNLLNIISKRKNAYDCCRIDSILTLLNNSLKIMRKNEIIHRNLNLENIFLKRIKEKEENYYIKLKLSINSCKEKDNFMIFKSNENILYYAPEILKGEKLDEKIDLWSLGVIIYILAFKEYPYKGERETELLNQIIKNGQKDFKKSGDADLDDLIAKLLVEDPKKRLNWDDYFNHSFFIKKYKITEKIGSSLYGNVYIGQNIYDNKLFAIKKIDKNKIKLELKRKCFKEIFVNKYKTYIDSYIKEVEIMKLIQGINNNTVKVFGYFNTKDEFIIIMELFDETLLNYLLNKGKSFNFEEIYYLLNQLNNSFKIMAKRKILFLALNLDNILIQKIKNKNHEYNARLKYTNNDLIINNLEYYSQITDLNWKLKYLAPEILRKHTYDEKVDLWSLGIIIYVLAFKEFPYKGTNRKEILNKIKKNGQKFLKQTDNYYLNDLIKKLLIEETNKRLNWEKYFNHSFFKNIKKYSYGIIKKIDNYYLIWTDYEFESKGLYKKYNKENLINSKEEALKFILNQGKEKIILITCIESDLSGKRFVEITRKILSFNIITLFYSNNKDDLKLLQNFDNFFYINEADINKIYEDYISNIVKENIKGLVNLKEKFNNLESNFSEYSFPLPKIICDPFFRQVSIYCQNKKKYLCMTEKGQVIGGEKNSSIWYITILKSEITLFSNGYYLKEEEEIVLGFKTMIKWKLKEFSKDEVIFINPEKPNNNILSMEGRIIKVNKKNIGKNEIFKLKDIDDNGEYISNNTSFFTNKVNDIISESKSISDD